MPKKKKLTYTSLLDSRDIHTGYERALEAVQSELGEHSPMFIGGRRVAAMEDFESVLANRSRHHRRNVSKGRRGRGAVSNRRGEGSVPGMEPN